ncbi:MaoC/PaaZ C-terminal domain-containing protein [soil metagenome]
MTATGSQPTVIELDSPPDLTPLLGKVALRALPVPGLSPRAGAHLPNTVAVLRETTVDLEHVTAYADVCGFRLADTLPLTYLHLLGFPLSVMLMTRPDFPFGLMGMVHIRNTILSHRPVGIGETVQVTAGIRNLRPHPKGQQLDNVVTVTSGGLPVWESTSTYLKRGTPDEDAGMPARDGVGGADDVDVSALPLTAKWRVPDDIGRRYGGVSGDRNPIHLTALSAKPFGFPRAIAHGMWTKARCLAALEGRLPDACTVDVAFKLPLLLPGSVSYVSAQRDGDWVFGVRGRDGKPHLAGIVTPA